MTGAVERIEADLCVIGAGSGGLSVAAGAAQMGARVVLVEKAEMGGDCLNVGCVPSKALLAAAARAAAHRSGAAFGVTPHEPEIDFAAVKRHVRSVIDAIAPHDSQERFEGLGVRVLRAAGAFVGPERLRAGAAEIRAKRFVIATGSRPALPPIPGLASCAYLTNETIFDLDARPSRLVIVGGGPIGAEMAQAHRRLGAEVVVLERETLLAREDPEAAAVVRAALVAEGVELRERVEVSGLEPSPAGVGVTVRFADGARLEGSHLLIATGRAPNVEGLGLETAGVETAREGVVVDARLRTSNRRIFAIGDVAVGPGAGWRFTHVAGYHAGIVIRNALFRLPAKASLAHVPRATYTAPELAQIGRTEAEARAEHGERLTVLRWTFADNDRAQAERVTDGFVKVMTDARGRIHGVTIVGARAGELIALWALAVSKGLRIRDLAGMVAPYPTLGEVSKRAAGQFYAPKLFSERTRWLVRQLLRLG